MTYTFTKDTPWGKKGEELEIRENGAHIKTTQGITYSAINTEIAKFLIELGVVEDSEWNPKEGDEYWMIYSDGDITNMKWSETGDDSQDKKLKYFLGIFPTREEAEKRRDQIKEFIKTL